MTFMTNKHRETIRQCCTRNPDNVEFPEYLPTSQNGEKEEEDFSDEEEAAGDEKWDLIEVIDEKSLKKKKPKSCDEEECQSGMSSFRELIVLLYHDRLIHQIRYCSFFLFCSGV